MVDLPPPPPPVFEHINVTPPANDLRWLPFLAFTRGTTTVYAYIEPKDISEKVIQITTGAKVCEHIPHEILNEHEQAYAESSGRRWSLMKFAGHVVWVLAELVRFDPNPPGTPKIRSIAIDIRYLEKRIAHIERRQQAIEKLVNAIRVFALEMALVDASEIEYLNHIKEGKSL